MTQYAVGQVWKYHTRQGEENSLLYIFHVDKFSEEIEIYHISLDNLKIPLPSGELQTNFPHLPVGKKTLDASVTELFAQNTPMPDIPEGYNYWREEYEQQKAGVFTIAVKKILEGIFENFPNA